MKYLQHFIICFISLTLTKSDTLDTINLNLNIPHEKSDGIQGSRGKEMSEYRASNYINNGDNNGYDTKGNEFGYIENKYRGYSKNKYRRYGKNKYRGYDAKPIGKYQSYGRNRAKATMSAPIATPAQPTTPAPTTTPVPTTTPTPSATPAPITIPASGMQSGGLLGKSQMMTGAVMQPSAVNAIAYGNAQFGQRLYEIMRKKEEGSNLLMSPCSVSIVMAMALLGARGDTLREMRIGMEFPSNKKLVAGYSNVLKVLRGNKNFTLKTANQLFVQKGYHLVNDFVKVLKERFYAEAAQTNFSASEDARKFINDWVEHKTNKTIKDLIPRGVLHGLTKLVLVNAIYLKTQWARKFDKQDTFDGNFYVGKNKLVKTNMMRKSGAKFKMINIKKLNAKAVEIPCKYDRVSMYILLPNDKFGLADVETKLFKIKILKLFSKVDASEEREINLVLPKFKLEKSINLKDHLKQLGMVQMFGNLADFSGISGNTELYVTAFMQKAFIEVNEEGSEASAATAMVSGFRSSKTVPQFICDHPFIFFFKHKKTDMVLFSGRIINTT